MQERPHSGGKPYVCKQYGKAFSWSTSLKYIKEITLERNVVHVNNEYGRTHTFTLERISVYINDVGKCSTFVTFNITSKFTTERNPVYVNNVGKHFAIIFYLRNHE
jgi:hypothetical protein